MIGKVFLNGSTNQTHPHPCPLIKFLPANQEGELVRYQQLKHDQVLLFLSLAFHCQINFIGDISVFDYYSTNYTSHSSTLHDIRIFKLASSTIEPVHMWSQILSYGTFLNTRFGRMLTHSTQLKSIYHQIHNGYNKIISFPLILALLKYLQCQSIHLK